MIKCGDHLDFNSYLSSLKSRTCLSERRLFLVRAENKLSPTMSVKLSII